MILNYIFTHLNAISLAVWLIFLAIVTIRFLRPTWVKNISFFRLAMLAIVLRVFYASFVTWAQYYVWSKTALGATLIKLPYFLQYAWTNFWMYIAISLVLSGLFYVFFKVWSFYRGGLIEQGAELLLVLVLISSYPGILVMVPIGFVVSILLFGYAYYKGSNVVEIEPAFIGATFVALLFTRAILDYVLLFINAHK